MPNSWMIGFMIIFLSCNLEEEMDDNSGPKLELIGSYTLEVPEPSGLTLNADGTALYSVSDPPDNSIYKLDLFGNTKKMLSYTGDDLEGITYDNRDNTLWIAEERLREVVHLDTLGNELDRFSINFDGLSSIHGFEGIMYNPVTSRISLLNEKNPGAFIELDSTMNISKELSLNFAQDYSGLCFNSANGNFMIVSDESQQLIEWNLDEGVIHTYSLDIEKAEGVDYDPAINRVYIVCDSEQRLYIYGIQH
jgi:uncharacterized protein YjiK|tara:strand:+ start:587 stop:1336 length:750 start_codon:yes stop_codon:yes gene_type:complete